MVSLLGRLAPLALTLRGSKRMFSDPERTLSRIAELRRKPASFTPPRSLSRHVDVSSRDVGGWPVFTIRPKTPSAAGHVVYFHGGSYVFQIDPFHWKLIARLVRATGTTFTVPIMPLAPDGRASVVVDRAATLVQSLVADVGAENVSVMGDSSGGGMTMAVSMELRDRRLPPLRSIVLIAPWLDISGTDPMLAEIAPRDPWLAVPGTHAAGALYRAELEEDDWRVSPIHGDLAGLAPITVFTGSRDLVHADALRLRDRAENEGIALDFHVGEGMIHDYPLLPLPEAADARSVIERAITRSPSTN
ncbi:alpha/beta hydrolase [Salinibacterium sp. UTAS2018]|nr:alpha/beta hydrolase [Salinibacterium sp. UTAS2018]